MKNRIHSDPFSARLHANEALRAISNDQPAAHSLKEVALELDSLSVSFSSAAAAKAHGALAALLRIVDALVQWRLAVLDAEVDADRFLRSARERLTLWLAEFGEAPATKALATAAREILAISAISDVGMAAASIGLVPLPLGVFEEPARPLWARARSMAPAEPVEEPVELTVAFLKFQIDGTPASQLHHVAPCEVHDLEIEVRVSRWPEDKRELCVSPLSVEPKSTFDFPSFTFEKPQGPGPYTMRQNGRAVLLLPQGMHARPFEFKYGAEFLPEKGEQPVAVVGHRTLIVDGSDVAKFQVCGYPLLDRKLFVIRDRLRQRGGVAQQDTADILLVLAPLCNLAGRAAQDAVFPGKWTEARFQEHVRAELRRNPLVGSELDEHAHGGGGITDLSFRGIPIELKVENSFIRSVDDCAPYFAQTASYAVAKSRRTAVLCVLDTSPKDSSAISLDTLLDLRLHRGSGVAICVLVIQGNLAKPSTLSR